MKTFRVDIFVGHRVVSWPFGRLEVSEKALTVRARPAWMLAPRTAQRSCVRQVLIRRRHFVDVITIDDSDGIFAKLNVNARIRGFSELENQLKGCGYSVTDRK